MNSETNSETSPLPKDEIAKAVVLSSLAYLDNEQAIAAVETRYSDTGFTKIVMEHHFILGFDSKESDKESDNTTTLYVAFRRRLSIQDMFAGKVAGRSEFIDSYREAAKDVEGLFHYGLFQIITSELPRISHFQHYPAKRIIFSGHGLAGALAHLFLICYMINNREEDREHISIGFGSPYFCDNAAKRFCDKTMELDRRMFTFVNDTDPVPWMLKGIRMTCTPESTGRTRVQTTRPCLERLNSANSEERTEITSFRVLKPLKSILKEVRNIGWLNVRRYASVGEHCDPRGSTLRSCKSISLNMIPESVLIQIDKIMLHTQQSWVSPYSFGSQTLDDDSCQGHRVESYVEAIGLDPMGKSKPVMEIAPNPCINACTLSVYKTETSYEGVITIEGRDLTNDCCGEPNVEPNVGHDWTVEDTNESRTVEDTSETKCLLARGFLTEMEANLINIWKKDEILGQTHLSVELRTCFGSTLADVRVEDLWKDGSTASALKRVMGKLLLMQQTGGLASSPMYREAFQTLESGFREIVERESPSPLDRLSYSIPETKIKCFDTIKYFLTRPVEIPLRNNTIGQPGDGHSYFSTSLSSHPELSSVIPDYAYISKFCHESYFSVSDGISIKILNYRDIVRTIYCLLSGTELQYEQTNVSYYEKEICNQVKEGQEVKRQDLQEGLKRDIEKRACVMSKVITASNFLESLKFAAFIGPENAGKTTLISSILGYDVGGVGFTTHTTVAAPYMFKDDIYLVDFPGTDGGGDRAHLSKIWEEYEQAPDLCVAVLNFGGDTSRTAQTFPRIVGSRMCSNIVLVINRVDSILNGSKNSPVWAEYSAEKVEQLKISIAEDSGLPTNRVFFSVSRMSEELEESTSHLLKERHIMLKDEITTTVKGFLLGLN